MIGVPLGIARVGQGALADAASWRARGVARLDAALAGLQGRAAAADAPRWIVAARDRLVGELLGHGEV